MESMSPPPRAHTLPVDPSRDSPSTLTYLAKQSALLRATTSPGGSRLSIDDDVVREDETCLKQGDQGQLRRGRVAARVGHESRAADLVPRELGQAVHRLRLQCGGLVLAAVPLRFFRFGPDAAFWKQKTL